MVLTAQLLAERYLHLRCYNLGRPIEAPKLLRHRHLLSGVFLRKSQDQR